MDNNIKVDIISKRSFFYRILYIIPYSLIVLLAILIPINDSENRIFYEVALIVVIIISVFLFYYHVLVYAKIGYFEIDLKNRKIILFVNNEKTEFLFWNEISIKVFFNDYKHWEIIFSFHRTFGIGNRIDISHLSKEFKYEFVLINRSQYIKFLQIMSELVSLIPNSDYMPISK